MSISHYYNKSILIIKVSNGVKIWSNGKKSFKLLKFKSLPTFSLHTNNNKSDIHIICSTRSVRLSSSSLKPVYFPPSCVYVNVKKYNKHYYLIYHFSTKYMFLCLGKFVNFLKICQVFGSHCLNWNYLGWQCLFLPTPATLVYKILI